MLSCMLALPQTIKELFSFFSLFNCVATFETGAQRYKVFFSKNIFLKKIFNCFLQRTPHFLKSGAQRYVIVFRICKKKITFFSLSHQRNWQHLAIKPFMPFERKRFNKPSHRFRRLLALKSGECCLEHLCVYRAQSKTIYRYLIS